MRAPQDAGSPGRRRRLSRRGRILLVIALVALAVLFFSLRGIAGIYTDFLWYDSLDLASVWSRLLGFRLLLGGLFTLAFFVLLYVNLWVADRLAPRFRPTGPEEELLERYYEVVGRRTGLVRALVSLLFAIIAGAGVAQQWNDWILFTNRVDFGEKDPLFGLDIGFYVFQLPFLSFLVSWLFAAFVIILIITTVAHYLNGGIRLQTSGQRVTPQVKAHLSVLLAVLALVKAAGYWLQRYELTGSERGFVTGAGFTDINAQLPAIMLLLFISLFSCGLFLYNIRRKGWVLPVVAVGLWAFVAVVAGSAYPWFVQRFRVEPSESSREAPYIQRNIAATREAFGLATVESRDFEATAPLTASDLGEEASKATLRNVRLLEPSIVDETFQKRQANLGWLRFPPELDVDRYMVDGQPTAVVIGARELDINSIPQESWEAEKLIYTHGFGLAMAPASQVVDGEPDYLVSQLDPPVVDPSLEAEVDQPRLYFSENMEGYAIVDTGREELAYQDDRFSYDGDGGVGIGSIFRRVAFALRFGDINPLISSLIESDSRIIFSRDVRERVEKLAPFLHLDNDPYPVLLDGRIVYIVDAYTTSSRYPYSERTSGTGGLSHSFNYARNSVKAVVDAYEGTVDLYLMPQAIDGGRVDPIAEAYSKAFPGLFKSFEEMPDELRDHVRHPEDMFRVQTELYGRYYIDRPEAFYEGSLRWVVSQGTPRDPEESLARTQAAPTAGQPAPPAVEERIDPQYVLMALPGEDEAEFVILRSFVPFSEDDVKRELTAWMVARPDGMLVSYGVTSPDVSGPSNVSAQILANQEITREISLLNQQGSEVELGSLLLVPIDESLLWVMPLYVSASGTTALPQLNGVVVVYGSQVVKAPSLGEALDEIFEGEGEPDEGADTVEVPPTLDGGADGESPASTTTTTAPSTPTTAPDGVSSVEDLAQQAQELFVEADQALKDGDLATYQSKIAEAQALVNRIYESVAPDPGQQGSA